MPPGRSSAAPNLRLTWETAAVPDAEESCLADDYRCVVQLRHGHPEALHELYLRFSGLVYRLCLRMLGDPHEAEETLQDTFLRLQAQSGRYDAGRGTVQTFVLTIAHHLCLERLRRRRSRPQVQDGLLAEGAFDLAAPPPTRDPLDRVIIEAALRELPELDQTLLEAMFYGGYTHAELTERLGLPLGTVKSRLRRALLKLRARMEADP